MRHLEVDFRTVNVMNKLKIACVQLDVVPGQVDMNLRSIIRFIDIAASKGAQLVVFPEGATADYHVSDFSSVADVIPGRQSEIISKAADKHSVWVAVGMYEKTDKGLLNTAVLVSSEGKLAGKYSKTHLSVCTREGTIAKETDVFLPGNGFPVFDTPFGIIGMMICKDGLYPEVPRVLAAKRAQIVLWLNNRDSMNPMVGSYHASLNCVTIAGVNRANGHALGGGSYVSSWECSILAKAPDESECIIYAETDMDACVKGRKHHQEQRRRRPELYGVLESPIDAEGFAVTDLS